MASIASIASSGMQAAQLRLHGAAHNVANMHTTGFNRQNVAQEAVPGLGGTRTSLGQASEEGVALEQEAVEQMAATYTFKANLQTLKAHDEMMGALLDIRA